MITRTINMYWMLLILIPALPAAAVRWGVDSRSIHERRVESEIALMSGLNRLG
jgi:hypothetical protein